MTQSRHGLSFLLSLCLLGLAVDTSIPRDEVLEAPETGDLVDVEEGSHRQARWLGPDTDEALSPTSDGIDTEVSADKRTLRDLRGPNNHIGVKRVRNKAVGKRKLKMGVNINRNGAQSRKGVWRNAKEGYSFSSSYHAYPGNPSYPANPTYGYGNTCNRCQGGFSIVRPPAPRPPFQVPPPPRYPPVSKPTCHRPACKLILVKPPYCNPNGLGRPQPGCPVTQTTTEKCIENCPPCAPRCTPPPNPPITIPCCDPIC